MRDQLKALFDEAAAEGLTELDYAADGTPLVAEGESVCGAELDEWPPLTDAELSELAQTLSRPLLADVMELLKYMSGFSVGGDEVGFPLYRDSPFEFFLPDGIILSEDGCGNHWLIEVNRDSGEWRHVWHVSHDPPVMIYQCETLAEYAAAVLDRYRLERIQAGHRSKLDDVDDACMSVCGGNKRFPCAVDARTSEDTIIAQFAENLPDDAWVVDLRNTSFGDGFDWRSLSDEVPVSRVQGELIFGVRRRPGKPRKQGGGWLSKLFGR
ncbi:MAG: SMI1/KNR4 family protein [Planctomycetota bacterium]